MRIRSPNVVAFCAGKESEVRGMVSLVLLDSGDVYVAIAPCILKTDDAHRSVGIARVAQSQYQIGQLDISDVVIRTGVEHLKLDVGCIRANTHETSRANPHL